MKPDRTHARYSAGKQRYLQGFRDFLLRTQVVILLLTTGGCAGTGLDAAAPMVDAAVPIADPAQVEATPVVKRIEELLAHYRERYESAARLQDAFSVPLIGVALVAACALRYGASTDVLSGFGLGAGALAAGRGLYEPSAVAITYLEGYEALTCLLVRSAPFYTAAGIQQRDLLKRRLENMEKLLLDAEEETLSSAPGVQELKSAIGAAEEAMVAARSEIAAFDGAPAMMETERLEIQFKIAKTITGHRDLNLAEAQSLITAAIQNVTSQARTLGRAEGKAADAERSFVDVELDTADRVRKMTLELRQQTQRLLRAMPGFVEASSTLQLCSNII